MTVFMDVFNIFFQYILYAWTSSFWRFQYLIIFLIFIFFLIRRIVRGEY